MLGVHTSSALPPALYEREEELGALAAAVDAAAAGNGRFVVIEGPAGIGKTSLLRSVQRAAAGMQQLGATASELETEFSFGLALQLFESRVRSARAAERESLFSGAARLAAPLFAGGSAPAVTQPTGLPVFHGLYWLTATLSEEAPLLMAIDDVQWGDRASVGFLLYLAQRVEDLPLAVVITRRTGETGASDDLIERLCTHPQAVVVQPRLLSETAAIALVNDTEPAAELTFSRACCSVTGGNPFLLLELVRGLRAEGMPPTADSAARVGRLARREPEPADLGVAPKTVRRAVAARLAGLPDAARAVAEAVSVLGPDATLPLAAAIADLPIEVVAQAADALIAAGLLQDATSLTWVHPLHRAAVYAATPAGTRARDHACAARALADAGEIPQRVVAHLLAAYPISEPWAIDALTRAAARAMADGDPPSAVRYLRRALEATAAGGRRFELLCALGQAEMVGGDSAASTRFAAAAELATEPAQRARVLLQLGRSLYAGGRFAEAAEAFERGRAYCGPEDFELEADLRAGWATIARLDPELRPQTQAYVEELLARGPTEATHGERVLLAHAAEHLVFACVQRDDAVDLARRSLGGGALLAEETSDGPIWFLAVANLGWCDEFDEYDREIEQGLEDARRRGSVWGFANASYLHAFSSYYRGSLADAVADCQQALTAAQFGWEQFLPAVHMQLAWAQMERGELAAAERTLESISGEERWRNTVMHALVIGAQARLALLAGDARRALEQLLKAGAIAEQALIRNPAIIAPWRSWAAIAAAQAGELARAHELVDEELELARRFGAARPIGVALRAAGLVRGGQPGIAALEEAVIVLEASPAKLELARALIDLGGALRRANRRVVARELLRRGLDLAHRFGAALLESQAQQQLLATGARPRRVMLSGSEALTPSERRVAELAARGMTNREIAQALFVTVKTVEAHLGHVFQKLDIDRRSSLADKLGAAERTTVVAG